VAFPENFSFLKDKQLPVDNVDKSVNNYLIRDRELLAVLGSLKERERFLVWKLTNHSFFGLWIFFCRGRFYKILKIC